MHRNINAFLINSNPETPRKRREVIRQKEKKVPVMGDTEDYKKCLLQRFSKIFQPRKSFFKRN